MKLPQTIVNILNTLESHGFAAYVVGGCVRDSLLGLTPADFDLCTSALPEQMEQVFAGQRLVLAGEKHGTVGVCTDTGVVEITTFRTEGDYRTAGIRTGCASWGMWSRIWPGGILPSMPWPIPPHGICRPLRRAAGSGK